MGRVDDDGVERHASILDVPDVYLVCLTLGHSWAVGNLVEVPGYGATVWRVVAECECGRLRADTRDPANGARLSRQYSAGHGLEARDRVPVADAWLELGRRRRAAEAGVEDIGARRRRRATGGRRSSPAILFRPAAAAPAGGAR